MLHFSFKTILFVAIAFNIISCNRNSREMKKSEAKQTVTLFGTEFLKGKVSSIIYSDEQGCD